MVFSSWLRNWKGSLERRSTLTQTRRRRLAASRLAPRLALEVLEDRTLLSPVLTVTNLAVSGSNGAMVSNTGMVSDTTPGATITTMTASAGTVTQNGNGSWSWSETTASGAAQTAPVTIYATDSNGQTAATDFWLNVGQVFIVNTTADTAAANLTTGQDSSGNISLRSAIQAVNAANASTPALIAFNIPGTGPFTIQPQSALDPINAPVVIDGYTQPGTSENTLTSGDNAVLGIELNGSQIAPASWLAGLTITADNSTVEGLDIHGFRSSSEGTGPSIGIWLRGGANDHIQGNFIGTDVSGTAAPDGLPNFSSLGVDGPMTYGVQVSDGANHNWIGTDGDSVNDPGERNIISATGVGVVLRGYGVNTAAVGGYFVPAGGDSNNTIIAGNFIGTDKTGTISLGNWAGIATLQGTNNDRIGTNGTDTDAAGESNVISGNKIGILFAGGDTSGIAAENDGLVAGNLIGPNVNGQELDWTANGTPYKGNIVAGLGAAENSNNITIGGTSQALANTIAYNTGPGVWLGYLRGEYATGIRVQGNSIHDNGGLGIDLGGTYPLPGPDGVTANDFNDHSGPNHFQNYPVLNSAISSNSDTSIAGDFSSGTANGMPYLPNTTFTLDFYASSNADPSGHGEGQTYLGSAQVTTDANGNASFSVDFGTGNLVGDWITATATDPSGNTSEFSTDIQATATPVGQSYNGPYLQSLLPQSSSTPNALTIQTGSNLTEDTVISAVNSLTAPSQAVTITLNLNGGTYNDTTVNPPANVTLIINGANGTNTFVGNSPAFTVSGGNVIVRNVTFTTATDAPTILVEGGILTLRNDTIQESAGATDAAISILGGSVDLGTTSNPGGNTLNVNATGEFVHNTTANAVSAVGDTFEVNGAPQSASSLSFTALTSSAAITTFNQAVTLTAAVRANGSSGTPTGSVDFFDITTNTDLGSVPLSGGVATLTTSALAAGNHVIAATYSGDANYLLSLDTITQSVHYNFSGFLPPLSNGLSFAVNRTIPIKFQLTDANGNPITRLSAVTSLQIQALDANGNPVGAPFNPTAAGGTGLRNSGGQYLFNWQTKGLSAGSYEIVLTLPDGTTHTKTIQLTAGGSSAGLVTGSSSGTSTAGALLGGEVDLYVDNANGDLTSDELARIQDAVNAVDATIAPYGVTISEVSDPTQANVTLNMATTSPLGDLAQGVLGCTTDADQVTMIQGWNWYAGSDPTQIAAGQYDFETAVIHELGHVLGLGHSSNPSSVMYATLEAGTADRILVAADLNVPADDSGSDALHAAPTTSVRGTSNGQGLTAPSSTSVPSSDSPLSAMDQVFADLSRLVSDMRNGYLSGPSSAVDPVLAADLTRLLSDMRNAYQPEMSSLGAMWQQADALALQSFDTLLSLEAGAMGVSKDTIMGDRLFASLSSPNGV